MATSEDVKIGINQRKSNTLVLHEIDEDDDDDDLECAINHTESSQTSSVEIIREGENEDHLVVNENEVIQNLIVEHFSEDSKNSDVAESPKTIVFTNTEEDREDKTVICKDASDAESESAYTEDSFCSEDSCNESEIVAITKSAKDSNTYNCAGHPKRDGDSKSKYTQLNHEASSRRGSIKRCSSLAESVKRLTITEKRSMSSCQAHRRRKNMTFTPWEVRKIEKENEILVKKIMTQRKPQSKNTFDRPLQIRLSSSAINRRKFERKVAHDNMLLLERIQRAKSCVIPSTSTPGYRTTYL